MDNKKYLSETDKVFIVCLSIFFIAAFLTIFVVARFSFKNGYEEAVKDFYYGKLKCDIVNEKVIWKD